jgi:predicted transcriptional regulator
MYVYLPRAGKFDVPFYSRIKIYVDTRARKPYCIYRVSGVKLVKQWKDIVGKYVLDKKMHPYILQGFFAGEGNIKFNRASRSRTIRIAQGKRNRLLEKNLEENGITNRYSIDEKAYVITARGNLEKLAKIEVAILHPEKNKRFDEMLATYKQHHYPRYYLIRKIYEMLKVPRTSQELAELFGRSVARVQDALKALKDGGRVQNFKVGSNAFWIRSDRNIIIISDVKTRYLDLLKTHGTLSTAALARARDVDFKSACRRLKELEKLD